MSATTTTITHEFQVGSVAQSLLDAQEAMHAASQAMELGGHTFRVAQRLFTRRLIAWKTLTDLDSPVEALALARQVAAAKAVAVVAPF